MFPHCRVIFLLKKSIAFDIVVILSAHFIIQTMYFQIRCIIFANQALPVSSSFVGLSQFIEYNGEG